MSITKNMFVELDENGDVIEKTKPVPKKTTTVKKKAETTKPVVEDVVEEDETQLHDSDHNIVEFLSQGRLGYPETFEYRDMLVRDEEVLATAKTSTYSRTLNSVLKSVMNDPDWYETMAVSDRDYALMWIWAQNYGSTKTLSITCSNQECKSQNTHVVDLTDLPVIDLKETIAIPYTMALKCGLTVTIHPPTVKDELFAEDWVTKNPSDKFETVMAARVIRLDREPMFRSKLEWLRNSVTGAEFGKIKRYQEAVWFGVDPEIKHTCPKCKEVTVGDIPFSTSDILWPTVHADLEEFV